MGIVEMKKHKRPNIKNEIEYNYYFLVFSLVVVHNKRDHLNNSIFSYQNTKFEDVSQYCNCTWINVCSQLEEYPLFPRRWWWFCSTAAFSYMCTLHLHIPISSINGKYMNVVPRYCIFTSSHFPLEIHIFFIFMYFIHIFTFSYHNVWLWFFLSYIHSVFVH